MHIRSLGILAVATLAIGTGSAVAQPASQASTTTQAQQINAQSLSGELATFFGNAQAQYLAGKDTSIYVQFTGVLFSGKQVSFINKDGDVVVAGNDRNDRAVRAALLLDAQGSIKGAALLHYKCVRLADVHTFHCDDVAHPIVTVFVATYSATDASSIATVQSLRRWALTNAKLVADKRMPGTTALLQVQVRGLKS